MPHYYDAEQDTPLKAFRIHVKARGISVELWSGNGVFSKNELDEGTKLLIDKCVWQSHWKVHDLGCGIGAVGIIAKLAESSLQVTCSDVSERAIELTKKNVTELKLDIKVVQSDSYAKLSGSFDTVLVNPPYVAGRETILRLIAEAHEHLVSGGLLHLVARHN
jgi:16S rRNA (guanine1207-N2)-methyltransferase